MELVSSRDEFPLFEKMILVLKKFIRSPSLLSPISSLLCGKNYHIFVITSSTTII